MRFRFNRGLTLVELLVVIAIIGILVAILVPAVMVIRETARRSECLNKQKNIAVALQAYHSSKEKFPKLAYGNFNSSDGLVLQPVWSWATRILPHMEQNAIYETLNPGDGTYGNSAAFVMDGANFSSFESTLRISPPAFRCVSDSPPELNSVRRFLVNEATPRIVELATSSYVASNSCGAEFIDDTNGGLENTCGTTYGTSSSSANRAISGHGVFGSMRFNVSITDISDGLSNTILIGERSWEYGPRSNRQNGRAALLYVGRLMNVYGYHAGIGYKYSPIQMGSSDVCATTGDGLNPVFERTPDETPADEFRSGWTASDGYSSGHRGGVNLAFADGSTRFVSNGVDKMTLGRLANISDGNVISEF